MPSPAPSPAALQATDFDTPTLFPLDWRERQDLVDLIRLDEAQYRAASFLDQRLLVGGMPVESRSWSEVIAAAAGRPARCHFIFHLGHVGSSLLSRWLGEHPALFSLREPAMLRTFARREAAARLAGKHALDPELDDRLGVLLGLCSRVWRPGQTALVKATSFVADMAADLLERVDPGRAILMFVTPPVYLRSVFAGPATRTEIQALAPQRLARLNHRLGGLTPDVGQLSEGEMIAMSWLCEMAALEHAAARHPGRTTWVDFERLLAEQPAQLLSALRGLGAVADDTSVAALLQAPHAARYAKAPEHPYDAALRHQLMAHAAAEHQGEIRKGMDWLGRLAGANAAVRRILETAAFGRTMASPPGSAPGVVQHH
jgi:hypothetical protein